MKILKNWSVIYDDSDPYKAPEQLLPHFQGNVYGHAKHDDGKHVITSPVKGKKNGLIITSSGSEYQLDNVDPKYEKLYPNAKERILNSLPELC